MFWDKKKAWMKGKMNMRRMEEREENRQEEKEKKIRPEGNKEIAVRHGSFHGQIANSIKASLI